MLGTKWFEGGWSYSWIGGTKGDSRSFVTRDVLVVGRAKLDCLEGGTHEETLRPQVNPKVKGLGLEVTKVLSRLLKDSRVR